MAGQKEDTKKSIVAKAETVSLPFEASAEGIIKRETSSAPGSQQLEIEDDLNRLFSDLGKGDDARPSIVAPTYDPIALEALMSHNNTLGPCVSAMEVNVAATGWEITPLDADELGSRGLATEDETDDRDPEESQDANREEDPEVRRQIQVATAFFLEPWPTVPFTEVRRCVRRDMEITGNGYMEVIRNLAGEIIFLRHLPASRVRLVKLDAPTDVEVQMVRNGKTLKTTVPKRERRYAQVVGNQIVYFKEFGSRRNLHRETGLWESDQNPVPTDKRANEVIHRIVHKDPYSPYGIPRWVGQLPSVLGSRAAEETNLEYLTAGGIPPMMITVQGGSVAAELKADIERKFMQRGPKVRAIVVEAFAESGSLDAAGASPKVTVERFGSERQKDSFFEGYDERCEKRVRKAFRLPPLFLGQAEDYSFASVFASYLVAERQTFSPERKEDDEHLSRTILREMGLDRVKFRSMPLTVHDVASKLKGVELASGAKAIDKHQLIDSLNEILDLEMEASEESEMDEDALAAAMAQQGANAAGAPNPNPNQNLPGNQPPAPGSRGPTQKTETSFELVQSLAHEAADLMIQGLHVPAAREQLKKVNQQVSQLVPEDRKVFGQLLAVKALGRSVRYDEEGAAELARCGMTMMSLFGSQGV